MQLYISALFVLTVMEK